MSGAHRLPDAFVIGAMKAGTTTVRDWLHDHHGVKLPREKEINFFGRGPVTDRQLVTYAAHFTGIPTHVVTADCSLYAMPGSGPTAAPQIAASRPDARLVFIARDPIERMRSHYRHEVQRRRERRPFIEAIADPSSTYVEASLYHQCLEPFLQAFPDEQLLVVDFDDLVQPPYREWSAILGHLGLASAPSPGTASNVTAGKKQFSPLGHVLWERGMLQRAGVLPGWVRRAGRRLAFGDTATYRSLLASADDQPPADVVGRLSADAARLQRVFGRRTDRATGVPTRS